MQQSLLYHSSQLISVMEKKHGLKNINISDSETALDTLNNIISFLDLTDKIEVNDANYSNLNSDITFKVISKSSNGSNTFKDALIKFQNHIDSESSNQNKNEVENEILYFNEVIKGVPKNYDITISCSNEEEGICKAKNDFPEYWYFKSLSNSDSTEIIKSYYANETKKVSVVLGYGKNIYLYAKKKKWL